LGNELTEFSGKQYIQDNFSIIVFALSSIFQYKPMLAANNKELEQAGNIGFPEF
jgi:hypothetical protein